MLHKHKEQDIFLCPAHEIFQVIIDVEKYPDFIPWCKAVYIKGKTDNVIIADLLATFHGIKGQYTSKITSSSPDNKNKGWIKVKSENGIFECLYNEWQFTPIDKNKTMVNFYIEFKFKLDSLSMLLNSVYRYTQNKIISAFKSRVEKLASQKLA